MAATTSVLRTVIGLALLGSISPLPTVRAAPPTTAPTTNATGPTTTAAGPTTTAPAPTTEPVEFPAAAPPRIWFAQLTSADPQERESAHDHLMGLTADQLPMLRTLVQTTRPLLASQVAPLHDIVVQAYLSTERYLTEPAGFLGLRWSREFSIIDEPMRLGVPVEVRLPGFPGFRALRDGDMIVGVLLEPDLPLDRPPNSRTPTHDDLTKAVLPIGPGRQIELVVIRAGEQMHIPVKLAAHPLDDLANNQKLLDERERRAEIYWQAQFVPLLSTSCTQ